MTTQQDPSAISHPVIKACAAWGCAGVAKAAEAGTSTPPDSWYWLNSVPWATLASAAAFIYTLFLTAEWAWKRVLRPLLERRGWMDSRKRDVTESEWAAMRPRK